MEEKESPKEPKETSDIFIRKLRSKYKQEYGEELVIFRKLPVDVETSPDNIISLKRLLDTLMSIVGSELTREEILGRSRNRTIHEWRMIFSKMARELGYSFSTIARFLSRDHSSIIHQVETVDDLIEVNERVIVQKYYTLKKKILGQLSHSKLFKRE